MRNLYGMRAGRTTVNNRLLSRGYRAYMPTTKPLLSANHRRLRLEWAQRWRNLTVAHWQHVIFGDESRFQLYTVDGRLRVRCSPGERFGQGCQAHRVQAGGGSVHVWGAFHNSAKSPVVLPDGDITSVLYRGILQNTICQALLGRAISSMDNPPQNLDELRQALLDKWTQIPAQRLQHLVASMPRRLARLSPREAGIPDIDLAHTKRDHQASSLFDQIYHNYLPVTFRYAHSANYSFYHQMSSKLTKLNRIKKWGIKYIENIILHQTTCP